MSKTLHVRPSHKVKTSRNTLDDVMQVRQPRPAARRQGTRHAVIAAAIREA